MARMTALPTNGHKNEIDKSPGRYVRDFFSSGCEITPKMTARSHNEKVFRSLLWVQASYTMITAIWPLVDIDSFIAVTGLKRDVWLVKTVGALLIPIAACLYSFLFIKTDRKPAIILGSLTALAFVCIDFYYAAITDVIADIYLADGVVELIFLAVWIYLIMQRRPIRDSYR